MIYAATESVASILLVALADGRSTTRNIGCRNMVNGTVRVANVARTFVAIVGARGRPRLVGRVGTRATSTYVVCTFVAVA